MMAIAITLSMQQRPKKLTLKHRALHYLSLREHSRLELGRKLMRYAEPEDDIEVLLDFLENAKLLSNQRFSETLVRRRVQDYGNNRILAELQTHQLDPQLLEQTKTTLAESEVARAQKLLRKKFGNPMSVKNRAISSEQRAKQIRFLIQRGFSSDSIRIALRAELVDQGDIC